MAKINGDTSIDKMGVINDIYEFFLRNGTSIIKGPDEVLVSKQPGIGGSSVVVFFAYITSVSLFFHLGYPGVHCFIFYIFPEPLTFARKKSFLPTVRR